jgi:hypothetical protein
MNTHAAQIAAVALAVLTGTADADSPPKLAMNVDPGLWQVTLQGDPIAAPAIPDALLQRMTPEQQAKMQAMIARGNGPQKFKQCMTAEKLSKGFGKDEAANGNCKMNVTTNTKSEFAAEKQCTADGGRSISSKIHLTLSGRHQASGTIDVSLNQPDGKTTTVHSTLDAQWLASDCGTIKDIETEK